MNILPLDMPMPNSEGRDEVLLVEMPWLDFLYLIQGCCQFIIT